eukprot:10847566-Karenia_brevis.AAC.2
MLTPRWPNIAPRCFNIPPRCLNMFDQLAQGVSPLIFVCSYLNKYLESWQDSIMIHALTESKAQHEWSQFWPDFLRNYMRSNPLSSNQMVRELHDAERDNFMVERFNIFKRAVEQEYYQQKEDNKPKALYV